MTPHAAMRYVLATEHLSAGSSGERARLSHGQARVSRMLVPPTRIRARGR